MATKWKGFASTKGCREWLEAKGFTPDTSSRKEVGIHAFWSRADGRKLRVTYGLLTATGQHSRGAAACWGHKVSVMN